MSRATNLGEAALLWAQGGTVHAMEVIRSVLPHAVIHGKSIQFWPGGTSAGSVEASLVFALETVFEIHNNPRQHPPPADRVAHRIQVQVCRGYEQVGIRDGASA
jgi:hypothetical protein